MKKPPLVRLKHRDIEEDDVHRADLNSVFEWCLVALIVVVVIAVLLSQFPDVLN